MWNENEDGKLRHKKLNVIPMHLNKLKQPLVRNKEPASKRERERGSHHMT